MAELRVENCRNEGNLNLEAGLELGIEHAPGIGAAFAPNGLVIARYFTWEKG